MSAATSQLLKYISKTRALFEKNNQDLAQNINFKRRIISNLKTHEFNTDITQQNFDAIVNDIFTLLESSLFDETHLMREISNLSTLATADPSQINICIQILEEIGNDLIKTGDYINPGISNDTSNPENIIHNLLNHANPKQNNPIQESDLLPPRLFNIPTDKAPSPSIFTVGNITYDASTPFTQQMLRFEELGRISISQATQANSFQPNSLTIPQPSQDGYPDPTQFTQFMNMISSPTGNLGWVPTKQSNITNPNPWASQIQSQIAPPNFTNGVAEGRAGNKAGEHRKWDTNSPPQTLTITCQTGVTTNTGCRDSTQLHQYAHGEFGPNGLYHKALNSMSIGGTTQGITPKFHFNLPEQKKESLWTFDGSFPPKLLMAKYGDPQILRHYNFLPIDPTLNRGFGLHTISTHEHNGSHNGISDGFAQSYFFPGEYYDYLYSMTLAGYTHINTEAINPKASTPSDWARDSQNNVVLLDEDSNPIPQPNINIPGDWKETMSTHWFHDHMLDFTSHNVYKGNAAMMNYYSCLDRGNERIDDGVNLRLPSGTALSWGNRDYDVNLVIADKAWDDEGQLWFNPFNTNGFLGDRMLVNWLLEPYFEVRARTYRFRILNAGVSRFMKFALVRKFNDATTGNISGPPNSNTSYEAVPFWMIANDGNLLIHSIKFDGTMGTTKGTLPVLAIAERFDIIVDFSNYTHDRLYLVNVLEHLNGKRPNKEIPLAEILNGSYTGDPCVMKFLEFRVEPYSGEDLSIHPSLYEYGKRPLIPITPLNEFDISNATQRDFNFVNKFGTLDEWAIETDSGKDFTMDPRRLSAAPKSNATELWTLRNGTSTWAHNVHIHYTEGKILLRDDQLPPIWEQFARKDVYRIGGKVDSSESIVVALTFNDTDADTYMMHCHNTVHEDHAMLLRYDIEGENCVKSLPCPLPTWEGVKFMETKTLPTFRTGMLKDNIFYTNPEKILKRLRQIDNVVPDHATGSYFVNGLGKSVQISSDE